MAIREYWLTWVTSCHNSKHQIGQLGSQLFSEDTQNVLLKISIYLLWKWLSWGFMGIHLISFYWLLTKVAFKRWADEKIQHRTSHCFPPNIRIKLLNSYSLLYCLRVYVLHRLKFKNKMLKCTTKYIIIPKLQPLIKVVQWLLTYFLIDPI